MKESKNRVGTVADQKRRIRERYKGINSDELDIIPAMPPEDLYKTEQEKRVAVYARVSTDDPRQTSSYELQKNYYEDVVRNKPNWILVEIYADEGISGTSLQHRDAFIRMIDDCKAGKIDLIVTKSVSRFARNVLDCIGYVRQLKAMNPPIGVFFETENIYTLNPNSEMSLSFISTLAQEESHTKSEIMNASIEMRFKRGIFLTPPLLGYDQDEDGNLVVNEDEARTVRLIFFMYLYGYTCQNIADTLTRYGFRTKKGNMQWSPGSVLQILQNERHCGDVLARKTWTPNYLDHKSKKNNQDRNQYRLKNHHESIISRDDFIAVQRLIQNAKYGNKGFLPQMLVITDGVLKGFVSINPRWANFSVPDYYEASVSSNGSIGPIPSAPLQFEASSNDIDLRGFEVARAQFFNTRDRISVSFTNRYVSFSMEAIRKLQNMPYIEMLLHPVRKELAVRLSKQDVRNHMEWSSQKDGKVKSRHISGSAFLPTIFSLLGWDGNFRYRVIGTFHHHDSGSLLLFDLHDAEMLIPTGYLTETSPGEYHEEPGQSMPYTRGKNQSVTAYPEEWKDGFGKGYYSHCLSSIGTSGHSNGKWAIDIVGTPASDPDINTTDSETLHTEIQKIIKEMEIENGK